jgi:hypothetical protein
MSLLALDLGTKTGAAFGDPGTPAQRVACETWELPSGGGEDVGAFMDAFDRMLSDRLMRGITTLVFEAPYIGPKTMMNMHTARRLIGLPALCEMLALRRGIPCFECVIPTVKANFAGHGRADKPTMMREARKRGFSIKNDHEADAAACWWWAVVCKRPELAHVYDPLFAEGAE